MTRRRSMDIAQELPSGQFGMQIQQTVNRSGQRNKKNMIPTIFMVIRLSVDFYADRRNGSIHVNGE